ncbi:hypothetical protein DIE23_22605 [Burkholderia sp. Bp9143]|uniref:hypothetical protein n=1 Tax=Burkholderia sp. Bp9143 TaxID=2184574 RepID=UPI000F593A80|nr:hypothetical protein [Burkholderia sp. Bp9143]RQR29040.1 hypothetical protein DIE23_22605 [Burkholderia sp. Bp9143]
MTIVTILAVAVALLAHDATAASYDGYDAFYAARPSSVFRAPVEREVDPTRSGAHVLYAYPGKRGEFAALHAELGRKALALELWQNRIVVNGRTYRFGRAKAFPGEYASDIFPDSAVVFAAERTSAHPPLICVEGNGSASGEAASRYRQVFLMVNPLARKPTFLQLPGLLSSCRAVVVTNDGKLAFPKNSYLLDDANAVRTGLLVEYYTFDGRRFARTHGSLRLRFATPENPFQFSLQDSD